MEEVKWDEKLSTGIHLIDAQHKSLTQKINKLSKAIDLGRPKMEIEKIIKYLIEYTRSHFGLEEEYMIKYKYPEYEFHRKEHRKFLKTVKELRAQFSGNNSCDNESVKNLQYEVWIYHKEHISVIDATLAAFLKSKGVKNFV